MTWISFPSCNVVDRRRRRCCCCCEEEMEGLVWILSGRSIFPKVVVSMLLVLLLFSLFHTHTHTLSRWFSVYTVFASSSN